MILCLSYHCVCLWIIVMKIWNRYIVLQKMQKPYVQYKVNYINCFYKVYTLFFQRWNWSNGNLYRPWLSVREGVQRRICWCQNLRHLIATAEAIRNSISGAFSWTCIITFYSLRYLRISWKWISVLFLFLNHLTSYLIMYIRTKTRIIIIARNYMQHGQLV